MSYTPSIRELALRAVIVALGNAGSPAVNVFRSKLEQITEDQLPCYDVSPGDEKAEDPGEFGDNESVTRTLSVSVRAIIDAAAQGAALDDSALDPFYVFAVQQLVGAAANLGGVVISVAELDGRTVFQPEGKDILGLDMTLELKFATKRGDPAQKG